MVVSIRSIGQGPVSLDDHAAASALGDTLHYKNVTVQIRVVDQHIDAHRRILVRGIGIVASNRRIIDRIDCNADRGNIAIHFSIIHLESTRIIAVVISVRRVSNIGC